MSCCDVGGRTKWGIFALLAASAFVCFLSSTPSYFGTLASNDPESFVGCSHCIQDFGVQVLRSVNASDIADKLQKIHERNEKRHPHHHHHSHHHHHDNDHFEFDDDECITSKDIDDLKPDLEGLVIPDWKEECKDVCTPVLKVVPLAATISGGLFFVGMICAIGSMIPLCMLCCGCCGDKPPPAVRQHPWQHPPMPIAHSETPVGTYAGPSAPSTADDPMAPLLTHKL